MNYITIDGVRYAPVTEANPSMDAIARGLAYGYWGESADKPLAELLDGLSVRVCDDGDGAPIEEVLADIANAIALAQPAKPVELTDEQIDKLWTEGLRATISEPMLPTVSFARAVIAAAAKERT